MKKLSLLSLLWLTGLLAFVATPIYAQDAEDVINETVNVVNETVDDTIDAVDNVVDDTVDAVDDVVDETEDAVDEVANLEWVEDFNSLFENE